MFNVFTYFHVLSFIRYTLKIELKNTEFVHALNGLMLPHAWNTGEIVLAGSCRPRSTLAAEPVPYTLLSQLHKKLFHHS